MYPSLSPEAKVKEAQTAKQREAHRKQSKQLAADLRAIREGIEARRREGRR